MLVVGLNEVVPCLPLLLILRSRVLQFAAPIREPVADLDVRESCGIGQVLLLCPGGVRVLLALHQPLLQSPLDVGRKQLLRVLVLAAQCGPGSPTVVVNEHQINSM